ncbi:MAG: mechanosensitive ion channel [Pelagibacterales bacterium]|nr:mechanosensitive ion channel [Pelagibacterales bacterium]
MNQRNINYDKLLEIAAQTVSSSQFYWQSLSLIFCFIISYVFYRVTKRALLPKLTRTTLRKNVELNRLVTKYINTLLYPLLSVIFISIGLSIYAQFFDETILFSTTLKLVALFLFLRFLRVSSDNKFITNTAGFFLAPALVLDTFGLLDSTITYLDHYALKIGLVRISIYLIIKTFVVILILFWASNLIVRKSKLYIENNSNIKSSTKGIIAKIIDIFIYSAVAIISLKTLGVDMTTFAVLGGAIGVGIGFGLQKIASNFISGIILLFERSIEIGDWVEIDNGNILGVVKHFSGRYTLIECFDGKEIMVPNEDFIINKVTNLTYSNNRARIEVNIGVGYSSDLIKVKEIMMLCAHEHPRTLSYPEVECYVTNFGEYDIKFTLYFWVSDVTAGRMSAKSEVMMNIWKKFKENDIKISLPQREMKIINDNDFSEIK